MTVETEILPIVSTWILLDDEQTASFFPQAGRLSSSDERVHRIYWRCTVVFFAVAIKSNGARCRYRLYTNVAADLSAAGADVQGAMQAMGVEIVQLPFTFNPPDGYCDHFRNQFYIFDILSHIASEGENRCDLVLDSDCLCLRPLDIIFSEARRLGAVTLTAGYKCGQKINGLTREEMQELFRELDCDLPSPPEYLCGELYCATSQVSGYIAARARRVFDDSILRWRQGKLRFHEEAQLLTYFYHCLHVLPGTADVYARRIWTGIHFNNGEELDRERHVLHLPAEKRFGFKTLFRATLNPASWFNKIPYGKKWVDRVHRTVSIPRPSKWKLVTEISSYAWSRVSRLLERA